jgi:dTDP-4-dehydrorhamnose reductase
LGVPIIHLSTDYVFDGRGKLPYVETDMIGPTTVYGMSKLLGERAVLAAHPGQAVVLRVAWVYSPFGKNFLRTMLGLATTREEIAVVDDQFGNPTSALDIADGILTVAANIVARRDPALQGSFTTAQGQANWPNSPRAFWQRHLHVAGRRRGSGPFPAWRIPQRRRARPTLGWIAG